VLGLAADNVQNECVARDLLIGLDLDDVARLNAPPIANLEALMALGEDKLLDWFAVYFFGSLLQFVVVQQVQTACCSDTCDRDEEHMREF